MKKFSIAVGAAIALAGVTAPAQAQSVTGTNGTTSSTSAIDESIYGRDMGGMRVSATFDGGLSLIGTWGMLDANYWGVFLKKDGTDYLRVRIGTNTNTYNNSWSATLYQSSPDLSTLSFEGGASYGGVLFDRETSPNCNNSFSHTCRGQTTDSDAGDSYDISSDDFNSSDVTYTNLVRFNNESVKYDLFSKVSVDFSDFNRGPDNDDSFSFKMDTDKGVFAGANIQTTVPEPSTYALMGAGLLGIFGFARRRNRNA